MNVSMTEGAVGPLLRRLSLPMTKGMLAYMAFNLVDTFFVGKLGPDALAAMSYSFPVVMIILGLSMGIATATSALVARAIGSKDRKTAARLTTDAVILAFIFVGPMTALGWLNAESIFRMLGADGPRLVLVLDYMQIWFAGLLFIVVPQIGNNTMRAMGDMHTPSRIIMLAAAINTALDPILIFGWGPIPRMELQGAALSSLLAFLFIGLVSFAILHRREGLIIRPRPGTMLMSWQAILRLAAPSALTTLITPLGLLWITYLASRVSHETVAAIGVAGRIEAIAMIGIYALALVMVPFVGQNYGARQFRRIQQAQQKSFRYALYWGLAAALLLAIAAPAVAGLFTQDPSTLRQICWLLWLVPVSYFGVTWLALGANMVTGLNAPLDAVQMNAAKVLLVIVFVWAGARYGEAAGLYASLALVNLASGAIAYWFLKRRLATVLKDA